jgi:hypothetical protein
MPSQGPLSPSTLADDTSFGSVAWISPENAGAEDAAIAFTGSTSTSHYLKATAFGFTVPSTATIGGIVAEVKRKDAFGAGQSVDSRVRLVKGGVVETTDKASVDGWPAALAYQTYGSSSDLWASTWTATDINDAGFGMVIAAVNGSPCIDHIRITVTYADAVAGHTRGVRAMILP